MKKDDFIDWGVMILLIVVIGIIIYLSNVL